MNEPLVPERLRLARELRLWSQADVAHAMKVSPAAISQFENGTTNPSSETVERLAGHLQVPAAFLSLPFHDTHEGFFRSLRKSSVAHRRHVRALAHIAHDVAVAAPDLDPCTLWTSEVPDLDANQRDIERLAEQVRRRSSLSPGPVPNVVELLEAQDVVVLRSPLDSADVDAFSLPFSDYPVVVLGTDKQDRGRSRFDAAHELGHLVMHGEQIWGLKAIEDQSHWFAAAFLMPANDIVDELPRTVDWPKLFALKQKWQVSLAALLMRARYLETLSPEQYLTAVKAASARGWRRSEPVPLGRPEQPRLLSELVAANPREIRRTLPQDALVELAA